MLINDNNRFFLMLMPVSQSPDNEFRQMWRKVTKNPSITNITLIKQANMRLYSIFKKTAPSI